MNYKKYISKIFAASLPFVDRMSYFNFINHPLCDKPISNLQAYYELSKRAEENTYSIEDVDILEIKKGFSIDRLWLNELALHTQVVIKKSKLNYAHGRVLYSVLRDYISKQKEQNKKINIIETGTARGFSALCMAKALSDSKFEGTICTIDVLPHLKKIFWNCASDHIVGQQTRNELLSNWSELLEKYIVFIQGYTRVVLEKIAMKRVNFAFLDGAHTFEDVLFEFNILSKFQHKGDILVFDDYNEKKFPGVVKAIKHIENEGNYEILLIHNKNTFRDYVIAKKITN